ncbi:uncharacterized protein [Watersipora subatra]|uniref:uncharacterized protein n=1 Tax=Watersipora subatra TaxID=2589382 RepID=UPI00355C8BE7
MGGEVSCLPNGNKRTRLLTRQSLAVARKTWKLQYGLQEKQSERRSKKGVSNILDRRSPLSLSISEKTLVKNTWLEIELEIQLIGPLTYFNLLGAEVVEKEALLPVKTTNTSFQDYTSAEISMHVLSILNLVRKLVHCIEDEAKMLQVVRDSKDQGLPCSESTVEAFQFHFFSVMKDGWEEDWSNEITQAFTHFFALLSHIMKKTGMIDSDGSSTK